MDPKQTAIIVTFVLGALLLRSYNRKISLKSNAFLWLLSFLQSVGMGEIHKLPRGPSKKLEAIRRTMDRLARSSNIKIGRVEDIVVPRRDGDGTIPVRLYYPDTQTYELQPVLVYFHGGGWVLGSIASHDPICKQLCSGAKIVVASVDYRLAPEYKFPAAPDDCIDATNWIYKNCDKLNLDASRIGVGGDSAGGNLAAVVSQQVDIDLKLQLLVYPVVDAFSTWSYVEMCEDFLLTTSQMIWFVNQYINDPRDLADPKLVPNRVEDLSGLPPAVVLTAEFDPLRDEGELYANRLENAGVKTIVKRFDGAMHGFFGNPMLDRGKESIQWANEQLILGLCNVDVVHGDN